MKAIIGWLKKADEKIFALIWLIATIAAVYFFAPAGVTAVVEIVVLKMIYVSVLLLVTFGVLFFLRGTQYDVYEEIFGESNIAAAIMVAAVLMAVATVIGK